MGYQSALEACGVTVKEFKEFGSYQGTWLAILSDNRIVEGSYGSCSGCDAFQAEFDWGSDEIVKQENGKYYKDNYSWDEENLITEEEALEINQKLTEKLKAFGQSYLNEAQSMKEFLDRYEIKCADEYAWEDDKEILDWLKTYKQQNNIE